MKIDLIIPTYNRSRLLGECLKSVFYASRPKGMNIRVVVVDNNSTDNTREVVQPYLEQRDLPCRYIFVGRPGKSAALNDALAQTDAEIVGLIDDDEQIDPAWFEVAYRELSADSTLEYIGGPCYPNWEIPLPNYLPPISAYGELLGVVLRPARVAFSPAHPRMLMGGNTVIRRSTLQRVMPYPEKLGKIGCMIRSGMDEAIHHRLLKIGALGVNVPELVIYHWIPAERLTKQYYRKWALGRGIGVGYQLRERGFAERGLLAIARYKIGGVVREFWSIMVPKSPHDRFLAELAIRDCLGMLYGRHIYGRVEIGSVRSIAYSLLKLKA